MASPVTLHEAQQNLPALLDRAEQGEEIVIHREGRPSMRLVPIPVAEKRASTQPSSAETMPEKRVFGQNLLGITYIAPDFDASLTEKELAEWGL